MIFKNRQEAGQKLAEKLKNFKNKKAIILALPRGGVVVGHEVAQKLKLPLDILTVRKIGAPFNPEFAIGAIAEGNIQVIDGYVTNLANFEDSEVQKIINREKKELNRRVKLYRSGRRLPELKGQTVILVDDGLATGLTMLAAIQSVRKLKPKSIIIAVPVCACLTFEKLKKQVDEAICLDCEGDLNAIGLYYEDFEQVSDEEVINLLKLNKK